jgi:hypothetical protein
MRDDLEARVKRLERENRRMRRGAILALVLAGGVVLMGQAQGPRVSDEVRTRRLSVVDETGQVRASIFMGTGVLAGPELQLADETGQVRAALGVPKAGPVFSLIEESGRVSISVLKDGPCLGLSDEAGFSAVLGAAALVTPKTGTTIKRSAASLVMFDSEKNAIWTAPK